jgi:hypothetical protein
MSVAPFSSIVSIGERPAPAQATLTNRLLGMAAIVAFILILGCACAQLRLKTGKAL